MELVLPSGAWTWVTDSLRNTETEHCVLFFANAVSVTGGNVRFLVCETYVPEDAEYSRRGPLEAELVPELVARMSKRARLIGASIVFTHTHIGVLPPTFSAVDDKGERLLADFLAHRTPGAVHLAMVASMGGVTCRSLGTNTAVSVVVVGANRSVLFKPGSQSEATPTFADRQVRAFGRAGQAELGELTVGIVGLGGTGSIVSQQLTHLGVNKFILLDPDVIEDTNLNRVVGARPTDVGRPKVAVAESYIRSFTPIAAVKPIQGDVIQARDGRWLLGCDLMFGCTDSHGSRSVLEQIAYQFLIPFIDMGAVISVVSGNIMNIIGRIQMLAPGLSCLTCSGLLDPELVRRDMMTKFERSADPYIDGNYEPAPAVISLNGTISSLAVTMALSAIIGIPVPGRHLIYRAMSSSLRNIAAAPDPKCVVCSESGRLARGDSWRFPGRQD
jgi:molybdopterin/thiamine biosynthesis adenylyltransferase